MRNYTEQYLMQKKLKENAKSLEKVQEQNPSGRGIKKTLEI
jgi:hypothetical protein